jgi:hypothetical protein
VWGGVVWGCDAAYTYSAAERPGALKLVGIGPLADGL